MIMRNDVFRLVVQMPCMMLMAIHMTDGMLLYVMFMPIWHRHIEEADTQHEKASQACLPAHHGGMICAQESLHDFLIYVLNSVCQSIGIGHRKSCNLFDMDFFVVICLMVCYILIGL